MSSQRREQAAQEYITRSDVTIPMPPTHSQASESIPVNQILHPSNSLPIFNGFDRV